MLTMRPEPTQQLEPAKDVEKTRLLSSFSMLVPSLNAFHAVSGAVAPGLRDHLSPPEDNVQPRWGPRFRLSSISSTVFRVCAQAWAPRSALASRPRRASRLVVPF